MQNYIVDWAIYWSIQVRIVPNILAKLSNISSNILSKCGSNARESVVLKRCTFNISNTVRAPVPWRVASHKNTRADPICETNVIRTNCRMHLPNVGKLTECRKTYRKLCLPCSNLSYSNGIKSCIWM